MAGVFLGLLFFSAALTPSLLPRLPDFQGVLCGFAIAVGYTVALIVRFIWWVLELRPPNARLMQLFLWIFGAGSVVTALVTLSRVRDWQNSIRDKMDMPQVEALSQVWIVVIAVVTAMVLILLTRVLMGFGTRVVDALARVLPYRTAAALGSVLAVLIVVSVVNTFVLQKAVRALDAVFAGIDAVIEEGIEPPPDGFSSGGPNSVIAWDEIGFQGKSFLSRGPTQDQISEFWGQEAQQPVRVYAGYGAGETFEEQAEAA
ncbi:MAG: alpha/beta-hydrolase N-terminal domain-containing protein, partial [Pseudomonadota bacterium]